MHILGISGSLRVASKNTALLRTAIELAPKELEFRIAPISTLPLFNEALTDDASLLPVTEFREAVSNADGVLIVTPEYNYGIPGPLKNAIDWASRPSYRSPFYHKPVGIIGASISVAGTARAQGQLKQVLLGMAAQVFPNPEFLLGTAAQKFDESNVLTDATTKEILAKFLGSFASWVDQVKPK